MSYHVTVTPPVSRLARGWGLSRTAVIRLWNRLYRDLESSESADALRQNRAVEDPEHLFVYTLHFLDEDRWHHFTFAVDDCQATGYLFVVDVRHEVGLA